LRLARSDNSEKEKNGSENQNDNLFSTTLIVLVKAARLAAKTSLNIQSLVPHLAYEQHLAALGGYGP
jgi:hypothetical protein